MGKYHEHRFPGESDAYREARDGLLKAERELRRQVEEVAALRRALPPGGPLKQDYVFAEGPEMETRFSGLFDEGKDSLVVYGFMYAPGEDPCPMCTAFLDSLDGNAPHITQRINLAVIAKAPIQEITAWARGRGWRNLRLLSSANTSFNLDYHAETPDGAQLPCLNVFRKTDGTIRHFYNAELFRLPPEPGQDPRHVDLLWPLWNLLDLTPGGRGADWRPSPDHG